MVGRLKPGATVMQAQQQVDALNARNMERFPHFKEILTNAGFHTVATPLQDDLVRGVRSTLYLLWGGVLFVLLIGVVNITNLVLVRSSGAGQGTGDATRARRRARPADPAASHRNRPADARGRRAGHRDRICGDWTRSSGLGLDRAATRHRSARWTRTVVAFTLALALAVGVIVGLVPVLNLRQVNLSQAFREESRSGTSGRGARAMRRALVAAQVAFAFMLLIGAGLLLASFQRVLAIDPGFEPSGVLTARVAPPSSRYPDDATLRTFADRLLEKVRPLPGVQQAGLTSNIPFGDDYSDSVILAEGYQMAPGESLISPFQIRRHAGILRVDGNQAAQRPPLQRQRHRRIGRRSSSSTRRWRDVLAGAGSRRPPDVQAGEPQGPDEAGPEQRAGSPSSGSSPKTKISGLVETETALGPTTSRPRRMPPRYHDADGAHGRRSRPR